MTSLMKKKIIPCSSSDRQNSESSWAAISLLILSLSCSLPAYQGVRWCVIKYYVYRIDLPSSSSSAERMLGPRGIPTSQPISWEAPCGNGGEEEEEEQKVDNDGDGARVET